MQSFFLSLMHALRLYHIKEEENRYLLEPRSHEVEKSTDMTWVNFSLKRNKKHFLCKREGFQREWI